MKAILVPPPHIAHDSKGVDVTVHPPLGLLCIATAAHVAGHEAQLCDLNLARRRKELPPRHRWVDAAVDYILSFTPDVVGFGTLCSSFPSSVLIARALKRKAPSVPILFGGPQATLVVQELLREVPEVDFVIAGEADDAFPDFLDALESREVGGVGALFHRRDGEIAHEPSNRLVNVESLPTPDYGLWPFQEAIDRGWYGHLIPIDAGRGCPFKCTFCSTNLFFKRRYRMKSPQKVVEEMTKLKNEYGFGSFKLTHDTFTTSRKDVIRFCHTLQSSELKDVRWSCSARVDTVDRELLSNMRESGCTGLFYGIESGTRRMQDSILKHLDVRSIKPVVSASLRLGLHTSVSTIVGFPEERWSDVEATIDILLRFAGIRRAHPQLHLLSPQPGTRVMRDHGQELRFDEWFPDRAYFNKRVPVAERRFVKDNPNLCSSFYYIPNDRVARFELTQVAEFASLLISVLPGVTAFLQRTETSSLRFIRRWQRSCEARGLPLPDANGFFTLMPALERSAYLEVLLDELSRNDKLDGSQRALLAYWRALTSIWSTPGDRRRASDPRYETLRVNRRSGVYLDARPETRRSLVVLRSDYDVVPTLTRWRERGCWRWPREREVWYVFMKRDERLFTAEVPRVVGLVIQWCNGSRSVREISALVDVLSDSNTSKLRGLLGTRQLTALTLSHIAKVVGLATRVAEQEVSPTM